MEYVTGKHALNLECSLETTGDWHTSALKWEKIDIRESDDSVYKDYGIEEPTDIPNRDEKMYHANHIRAILDILERGNEYEIRWLIGFRDDFLCTDKYNNELFKKVIMLRENENWSYIDSLMNKEFMNLWVDYKDNV